MGKVRGVMEREPVKWKLDKKGIIKEIADKYISSHFKALKLVKILYTWRSTNRMSDERMPVYGTARKVKSHDRDIFGYDFEIEIARNLWKQLSPAARHRLIWHELRHCTVTLGPDMEPEYDAAGRIKLDIDEHDLVIKTFRDEIKKFGVQSELIPVAKLILKNRKKKFASAKRQQEAEAMAAKVTDTPLLKSLKKKSEMPEIRKALKAQLKGQ